MYDCLARILSLKIESLCRTWGYETRLTNRHILGGGQPCLLYNLLSMVMNCAGPTDGDWLSEWLQKQFNLFAFCGQLLLLKMKAISNSTLLNRIYFLQAVRAHEWLLHLFDRLYCWSCTGAVCMRCFFTSLLFSTRVWVFFLLSWFGFFSLYIMF